MTKEIRTLRITGSVKKPIIRFAECQTCGGALDITIPFSMPGDVKFTMLSKAARAVADDTYAAMPTKALAKKATPKKTAAKKSAKPKK